MPETKKSTKKFVKNLDVTAVTFDGYINERVLDVDSPELGSKEMYNDPDFQDLYALSLRRLTGEID